MAIEDSNINKNNQQAQPGTRQESPYGQPVTQQQQPPQHPGLGRINQVLPRSGSFDTSETRSAEALRGLKDAAEAAKESQRVVDNFEIFRFDRDANRVGLAAILVTRTIKIGGKSYTAVRTLLLDNKDVHLRPRVVIYGNQRIEATTRPQDVFNDVYWNRIVDFLRRTKGIPELVAVDAGPLVIPAEFDFKDDLATGKLLVTSVNRCDDIEASLRGERPFTVADVKRKDERLTARIDTTGQPVFDIVGQPIRADITVSMNRQSMEAAKEDDYYDAETEFNRVSGFINLEYAPTAADQPQLNAWGQPQMQTQMFTPAFIITDVSQADWVLAQTPELYLLAISNAYRVTAGTAWVRSFLPTAGGGKKGIDMRDIGALGYLSPAGVKPDTKSETFTDKDFVDLMSALVRPNPSFFIDVNQVGDHAAIENYFVDAAIDGGKNQMAAVAKIVKAADNLTGGAFSRYFNANEHRIVGSHIQEVHLGWYLDQDNEKRDIRDLDVLAMLNLCQGDLQELREWYLTYFDTTVPVELRLQRREAFERQYLSKSLRITGRALRLALTGTFIEALDKATREAGVQVEFEDMTSIMGAQRFVGNPLVNQYMVSGSAPMGYTRSAGGSAYGYSYGGVTGSGRLY